MKPSPAVTVMVGAGSWEDAEMRVASGKSVTGLRATAVALLFGAYLTAPGAAQQPPSQVMAQTANQQAEQAADGGFDDWGLLGLLGLAGLAGLRRQER
jgi:MYXO-CTERM domain-containing protein